MKHCLSVSQTCKNHKRLFSSLESRYLNENIEDNNKKRLYTEQEVMAPFFTLLQKEIFLNAAMSRMKNTPSFKPYRTPYTTM